MHQPNSLVIVVGDFNSISTGLRLNDLTRTNNLKQLVNFKTRDSATLDWFLTNKPRLFQICQLPKLATTDHYMILVKPTLTTSTPSQSRKVKVRDLRDSAWKHFRSLANNERLVAGPSITLRVWKNSTCLLRKFRTQLTHFCHLNLSVYTN